MTMHILGEDVSFEGPWAFALLLLVVLALVIEARRERVRPASMLFSSLGLLPPSRTSWRVRSRWLLLPVRVLGASALIAALAAPSVIQASYDVPAEGSGIQVDTVVVARTGKGAGELDEALMKQMASLAGGQYYHASDEAALRNIYSEITALEKARVGSRGFIETSDATLPFIAIGAALLALEIVLSTTVFRRTP